MKWFHANIGAMQGALEQAPEVLQSIRVNATMCIADSMVDNAAVIVPLKVVVGHEGVRANDRSFADGLSNVSAKFGSAVSSNNLQHYPRRFTFCRALQDTLHSSFLKSGMAYASSLIFVHVACLRANVG